METLVLPPQLSREFLLAHGCCPLEIDEDGRLVVATADEQFSETLDDLALAFGAEPVIERVDPEILPILIERLATRSASGQGSERPPERTSLYDSDVRELATQAPVVRYVNLLLGDGVAARASDVHLESLGDGFRVRLRVDGSLIPGIRPPPGLEVAVVSRLKLLAGLDIAEKRSPQDGRFKARIDDRTTVDLRVATSPTAHGESVVLRILDRAGRAGDLESLGIEPEMQERLRTHMRKPTGLILTTGPTGSGKTTTLYALLGLRDSAREKIITIEDPIEYSLHGVNQIPVNRDAGVTFASALRSVLRQDPDVVMVGEIRDSETATLAVQAALTGHLVLASLHTNDAPGAWHRLIDLGVPEFLLDATLSVVLAQRLLRRRCVSCSGQPTPAGDQVANGAAPERAGCPECRGTGYSGRLGVFDLLEAGPEGYGAVGRQADDPGLGGLSADAARKVAAGVTTDEEVFRVLG